MITIFDLFVLTHLIHLSLCPFELRSKPNTESTSGPVLILLWILNFVTPAFPPKNSITSMDLPIISGATVSSDSMEWKHVTVGGQTKLGSSSSRVHPDPRSPMARCEKSTLELIS